MLIWFFRNKANPYKYMEVHSDERGHYSVRQVLRFDNDVINYVGDGKLHRWRKGNLNELLEDYQKYPDEETWRVVYAYCLSCHRKHSYVMSVEEQKAEDEYYEKKCYGKFPGYIQDVFPKMPQHMRAAWQSDDGTCCVCPRCSR